MADQTTRSKLTRQDDNNDLGLGGPGIADPAASQSSEPQPTAADEEQAGLDSKLADRLLQIDGVGPATAEKITTDYPTLSALQGPGDIAAAITDLGVRADIAEKIAAELDSHTTDDNDQSPTATPPADSSPQDPLVAELTEQPTGSREAEGPGRTQQVRVDYSTYRRLRAAVARLEAAGRDAPTMTEIATHALDRWLDLFESAHSSFKS